MVLQACLNGDRTSGVPITPEELADEARACAAAGADSVHVHPRDGDGNESLEPHDVAAAVQAIRAATPRTEISVSTGLWITLGDVDARLRAIAGWTVRPDVVSLNIAEEGWSELAELLIRSGIGIEVGVWNVPQAQLLAESGLWRRAVRRILVEPRTERPEEAVLQAIEIDSALEAVPTRRLQHGIGAAAWPMLDAAVERGHDIRIGLEDVLTLPDGRRAPDNAAMVVEAALRYR
jgi:uncharacterized protein (DUF849 family)